MPARSRDPIAPGEPGDILSRLETCVRQGDWAAVTRLKDQLPADDFPATAQAIAERIRRLQSVLIAARVARANLGVSLGRLRAAAQFAHSRRIPARQEFAAPADF
jgi:hypothetical protein